MMNKILYNKIDNFRYLLNFVMKAFLLAIISLMVLVFILFGVYFIDLLVNVKSGNYRNPLFNGYVIVSQSMVPTININDAIVVKRIDNDSYKVGDIISFITNDRRFEGSVVTHRIVNKEYDTAVSSIYTTKGDNNLSEDPDSVYTSMINGKVLFKIPKIGYIQSFLSNPINFISCMIGSVIILIFGNIIRTLKVLKVNNK